uniref:Uncharacterized protein n=1 Tax=Acidithiobacillus sulfuriphilus TaxID=1867749 RepID=A0A3M8RHA3_9PROT|nr:hypothetical protein EC580_03800 [Acidithiobacillus sulfuriphilus]
MGIPWRYQNAVFPRHASGGRMQLAAEKLDVCATVMKWATQFGPWHELLLHRSIHPHDSAA